MTQKGTTYPLNVCVPRAAKKIGGGGGQGKYTKVEPPQNGLCEGGSGGMLPGHFESLHVLKCVLGAPEDLFCHAHSSPASCCLRLAEKYNVQGPIATCIASGQRSNHVR